MTSSHWLLHYQMALLVKTLLLRHCTDHQLHLNPPPPPPPLPQMAYKPWLCAQFFPTARRSCKQKVPCHQYCLEVQQSCPFILPDNDDLIHGGSPSFICTGQSCRRAAPRSLPVCDVESCETLCVRARFLSSLAGAPPRRALCRRGAFW